MTVSREMTWPLLGTIPTHIEDNSYIQCEQKNIIALEVVKVPYGLNEHYSKWTNTKWSCTEHFSKTDLTFFCIRWDNFEGNRLQNKLHNKRRKLVESTEPTDEQNRIYKSGKNVSELHTPLYQCSENTGTVYNDVPTSTFDCSTRQYDMLFNLSQETSGRLSRPLQLLTATVSTIDQKANAKPTHIPRLTAK